MSAFPRIFPQRIKTQIALLVMASLVIAHLVIATAWFALSPRPDPDSWPGTITVRLALIAPLLEAAQSEKQRADMLNISRIRLPQTELADLPQEAKPMRDDRRAHELRSQLGEGFPLFDIPPDSSNQAPRIAVQLPSGKALIAPMPRPPGFGPSPVLIVTLVLFASAVTLLSVWAAVAITAPLARFADAADGFTLGRVDAPLPERGPREIVRMARALNGMRERIQHMVEDRARMLAAISHDLRTPITRLRLRAEEIEPAQLRMQVVRDLESMQGMVHSALSFLRDEQMSSGHVRIDLSSLVQTICDDFDDAGYEFRFNGPSHPYVSGNPDQLVRAITNLAENGFKFAGKVVVTLGVGDGVAFIDIEDNGPGIPDADKLRVLEPFYRGDLARSADGKYGFGLGLSISRAIAEAHHGSLSLHDVQPSGLRVRLTLPLDRGDGDRSRDGSQLSTQTA